MRTASVGDRPPDLHWHSDEVVAIDGAPADVFAALPTFTRMPFGANPSLDVVFCDTPGDAACALMGMPVGVVSKKYVLMQHGEVIDAAFSALASCGIDPADVRAQVSLTSLGTRMAACLRLPEQYSCDPGDGYPIDLTFECYNSVDRSVPLFALVGWYRIVCSNGLVVGTTAGRWKQKHVPPLDVRDLEKVLRDGLVAAIQERGGLAKWTTRRIPSDLARWIDGPVADAWGALAAGRVYFIIRTGHDGDPEQRFERVRPHERFFRPTTPVPGAPDRSKTMFDVAQALSWVASHRHDFQERLTWRGQIPKLMDALNADDQLELPIGEQGTKVPVASA